MANEEGTQSLTIKPIDPETITDPETGRTIAVHSTEVVTDPDSPEAVQVPDPEKYPSANATEADPLARTGETPNEAFSGDAADVNEVQRVTPSGTVSGGDFTLTFDGDTTDAIDSDANAADIKAALVADTALTADDITVTGGPVESGYVEFTFTGDYAAQNVPQIASDDTNLTGTGATLTDSTVTAGHAAG